MADQDMLGETLARLEAALSTLEAGAADGATVAASDLAAVQGELSEAKQTIASLEAAATATQDALDSAIARAEAAEALAETAASQGPGTEALEAEIAELKAARAQDLVEMKALLAELEPMLENSNA